MSGKPPYQSQRPDCAAKTCATVTAAVPLRSPTKTKEDSMSVVVMNRYIGGTPNEVMPIVEEWKEIMERNGAESVRLCRFHTGPFVG